MKDRTPLVIKLLALVGLIFLVYMLGWSPRPIDYKVSVIFGLIFLLIIAPGSSEALETFFKSWFNRGKS